MSEKALQFFSDEALERSRKMSPDQIIQFLDDYRKLVGHRHLGRDVERTMISIRIPTALLQAFRSKAQWEGTAYQTKIQELMLEWLEPG